MYICARVKEFFFVEEKIEFKRSTMPIARILLSCDVVLRILYDMLQGNGASTSRGS